MDGSRKGSSVRGPAGDGVPTGASACIQCARDVLAALKVVHSDGFAHLDVIPANVIHCTRPQDSYHYRLVGFGSALQAGDSVNAEGGPRATGSPGYRAPELFGPCTASAACDVWSLGATMFELATGLLRACPSSSRAALTPNGRRRYRAVRPRAVRRMFSTAWRRTSARPSMSAWRASSPRRSGRKPRLG